MACSTSRLSARGGAKGPPADEMSQFPAQGSAIGTKKPGMTRVKYLIRHLVTPGHQVQLTLEDDALILLRDPLTQVLSGVLGRAEKKIQKIGPKTTFEQKIAQNWSVVQ